MLSIHDGVVTVSLFPAEYHAVSDLNHHVSSGSHTGCAESCSKKSFSLIALSVKQVRDGREK